MTNSETKHCMDEKAVLLSLVRIIETMTSKRQGRSTQLIGPEKYLGADLGLKSLDFVRLAQLIRQEYDQQAIPFQNLFVSEDGGIREDISLGELAAFLSRKLRVC